jgi:hypothetical protein
MSLHEVSTAELADALRLKVDYPPEVADVLPEGYGLAATEFLEAVADRLAAYERIVAGLRAMSAEEPELYHLRSGYTCWFCRETVSDAEHNTDPDGWHARTCPWALAQQTKGGEA